MGCLAAGRHRRRSKIAGGEDGSADEVVAGDDGRAPGRGGLHRAEREKYGKTGEHGCEQAAMSENEAAGNVIGQSHDRDLMPDPARVPAAVHRVGPAVVAVEARATGYSCSQKPKTRLQSDWSNTPRQEATDGLQEGDAREAPALCCEGC